jgi:hypothetical protein
MKKEPCGCEYDGPVQVLCCGEHNIPAKNLNRAQVMINERDMEIHFLKEMFKSILENADDPKKVKSAATAGLNFKLPKEFPFTKEQLDLLMKSPFKGPNTPYPPDKNL